MQMNNGAYVNYAFGACSVRASSPLATLPVIDRASRHTVRVALDWGMASPTADVAWDHHWIADQAVVLSMARLDDGYWLRVPNGADFRIRLTPPSVLLSPAARALDPATLEHLLVDQILPRVLAQLGSTMIHASSAKIGNRHVLFTGPSGWGKSTLAGLLHQRGHLVLSDDCVQLVATTDGRFEAIPTYPSLRLNPDSLASVFPDDAATSPVADYSRKRRVAILPAPRTTPALVDAIYLLGDPAFAEDTVRVTKITPAQTCIALIKHSFRLDLADRKASAIQLQQCSEVARTVPGFRLDYPRDHARHDMLIDALLEHVDTLGCARDENARPPEPGAAISSPVPGAAFTAKTGRHPLLSF